MAIQATPLTTAATSEKTWHHQTPTLQKPWVCRAGILHAYGTLASAIRHNKEFTAKGYGVSYYLVQGTPVCSDSDNPNGATYGFTSLYSRGIISITKKRRKLAGNAIKHLSDNVEIQVETIRHATDS